MIKIDIGCQILIFTQCDAIKFLFNSCKTIRWVPIIYFQNQLNTWLKNDRNLSGLHINLIITSHKVFRNQIWKGIEFGKIFFDCTTISGIDFIMARLIQSL